MTPDEAASAAGRALGQIKTAKKTASSRETIKAATAARTANAKPCTCGRTDGSHRFDCPEYRRQAVAKYRKKQKESLVKGEDGQGP